MAGLTSMDASPTGSGSGAGDRLMQQQQQQQSDALHTQQCARTSSSGADALPWRVQSPARSSGVRRRREESIEIEELDSDTMRQNAYNYFQRYASRSSAPAYNISGPGGNGNSCNGAFSFTTTTADRTSPALRTGSSRKRQRTLADRLDELSIGGVDYFGRRRGGASSSTNGYRSSASSVDAMMDGDSSSDERRDNDDEDDDSTGIRSELMVYGGDVPGMKGFFFGSSRRKPMDRVFRHYAAVANQAASSSEPNGNELVVFRRAPPSPPPTPAFLVNLPYLSLSPQELEALSRQEKSKRASIVELSDKDGDRDDQDSGSGRRTAASSTSTGAYRSRSGSCSASSTSSPPFRALGVPRTDSMEDFDDVDMEGEGEPKQPHLSGDVSHSEWFLSDDEL